VDRACLLVETCGPHKFHHLNMWNEYWATGGQIPWLQEMVEVLGAVPAVSEAAYVRHLVHVLLSLHGGEDRTHFHNDKEMSRGGCSVQTRFGVIDGRRETKFEALKKSLLQ
jgi:hypothetical protein